MTLPTSGPISIGMVAAELGIGLPLSLGDPRVRALAGVPSGPISLGQLRGKSAYTPMTLSTLDGTAGPVDSTNGGGTISASASAAVTGGSGGATFAWAVTSNPSGCTIGALNSSSVSASRTFAKLSNGEAHVLLSVTATDNTSHTVTKTGVAIDLYWGSNL